ncbi:MAG: hypothetical protein HY277_07120 [Ignavibacteriales bacterium]|nr:hypothetical protein [Ignavibacteriales bacterium]
MFVVLMGFHVIFTMLLCAQVPSKYAVDIHSKNERYVLHMEGKYYEGYIGLQELTLRSSKKILWKKNVEISTAPVVSNLGDVALIGKGEGLYDTTGQRLGVLTVSDSLKSFYAPPPDGNPIHSYSVDGKLYFTFLNSRNDSLALVAADRTGKERWRVIVGKTGQLSPTDIQSFDSGVVIHNYSQAVKNLVNVCYLIDESGRVVGRYSAYLFDILPSSLEDAKKELHLSGSTKLDDQKMVAMYRAYIIRTIPPTIDSEKRELHLLDTTCVNIYDLHSGRLKKSVPFTNSLEPSR